VARVLRGLLLLIIGACAFVVGCGDSSRDRATAYARAVNLHRGDVPGMAIEGHEGEAKVDPHVVRLVVAEDRCLGSPAPTRAIAEIHSVGLRRGSGERLETVNSMVTVMPTGALASQNIAGYAPGRERACAEKLFDLRAAELNLRELRVPLPQATEAVGERSLEPDAKKRPLYRDHLGFRVGQADIFLKAVRYRQPPSTSIEERLLSLLYNRAKAHEL
jgi:hypothetical protein